MWSSFPNRIFGSSHLAHAMLHAAAEAWDQADGRAALAWLSRAHGLVYFAALIVFAHRLRGFRARFFFLLAGAASPAACFACGYLELGQWPSMWAALALALTSRVR